jgi:hypothetical protein
MVLGVIAGVVTLVNDVHCVMCTEQGCIGGFEWSATPADGSTIVPGEYLLVVVVEGTTHEIVCTIAAGAKDSECTEPTVTDGDGEFDLSVSLDSRQANDSWDSDAPIESLRLFVADHTDLRDDDRSDSVRGPEEIDIAMRLGTRVLFDEHFEPEYMRNETFWGDERCGYCDELVTIPMRWAQ